MRRAGCAGRPISLLVAALLVSCASTRDRLLGDWQNTTGSRTGRYSFRSDGTFSGDVSARGRLVSKFTGRWRVERNALLYVYEDDALGVIASGTQDRDKLLEVARDYYVIEATDGSRRTYRRVR